MRSISAYDPSIKVRNRRFGHEVLKRRNRDAFAKALEMEFIFWVETRIRNFSSAFLRFYSINFTVRSSLVISRAQ